MPRASILIPCRNRAGLLAEGLRSIRAKAYHDTEVIVLDDGSTDDMASVRAAFPAPFVRWERIDREGGYREDPASVFNYLMAMASGDTLIQQSPEVIHLTRVAQELTEACEPGVVAFATVLDGAQGRLPGVDLAVRQGWRSDSAEWAGSGAGWVHPRGIRGDGGRGTSEPPVTIPVGKERVQTYTSVHRQVPYFFCGAIMREDWARTGGYPEGIPHGASDLHLAFRMIDLGLRFRFLGGAIAYHISHDKT